MKFNTLGNTREKVSAICLGTMTWGEQNSKQDAFNQMDYALEQGVNFFDTAEMYPVPPLKETQGRTERYIGDWMRERGNRDKIFLATKVTGRSENFSYLRGEDITCLNRKNIEKAIDSSLQRLQTDYIDLYQIHWPDRSTNNFGQRDYKHQQDDSFVAIEDTLKVLEDLITAGKVKYIGISNETPWGVSEYLRQARSAGLPRIMCIQNPYNLLNRTFEVGLAEMAIRDRVGLLAYSPLAFGMLTGKYLHGQNPENARLTLFQRFSRYKNKHALKATEKYVAIAKEYDLDPAQMALAYVNQQPFVATNIIGATTLDQLKTNIDSINITLPEAAITKIEQVHNEIPNPAP